MQIIGFNFSKIAASREKDVSRPNIDTHIEFVNLEKTNVDLLKDLESSALDFKCTITYTNTPEKEEKSEKENKEKSEKEEKKEELKKAEIAFEGNIILALSKDESKDIFKSWKEKALPNQFQIPLYNLILRKCTPKAVSIADEIALPSPIPMPKIRGGQ